MASDLSLKVLLEVKDKALGPLKSIAKGSDQLAKGLDATQQRLRQLGQQNAAIEAFQRLKGQAQATGGQLSAMRARLAELKGALPAAGAQYKAYAGEIKAGEKALARLQARQQSQLSQLRRTREQLKSLGVDNIARQQQRMGAEVRQATAALRAQETALKKLEKARQDHTKSLHVAAVAGSMGAGAVVGGKALVRASVAPLHQYMAHEDAMLGIARQVPGARDEMGRLTDVYRQAEKEVRELSETIPLTTVEIANMTTAAARMEVPTEHLKEQVKLAEEMAIAFDAVPDEIAESMGKVAKNFRIPVTDIRGLADTINYLDDNAISKGSDIIDYLNRTSGVVSTVAMSSKQAAALGSTLLTLGERTETASTATNAIIQTFAAAEKGKKGFRAAIKELGLGATDIQQGMQRDAMGTLLRVFDAIQKLPEDKRIGVMVDLVGKEHSDTLAKLVSKPDELRRQLDLAGSAEAGGSMAREAQARYATTSAQMQLLENQLFNLRAVAGQALAPALAELLAVVTPVIKAVTQWMQDNPVLTKRLMMAAVAVGALMTVLGALAAALAVAAVNAYALRAVFALLAAKNAAAAAQMGATAARAGLLARAAAGLKSAWGAVVQMGGFALQKTIVGLRLLGGQLMQAGAWLLRFGGVAARAFMVVGRAALALMASPIGIAFGLMAAAVYMWVTRWQDIKGGALLLWQDIKQAFMDGLAWLQALPQKMWEAGSNIIGGVIGGIRSKLDELKSSIVSVADSARGWFAEKLKINSPSRVFMQLGGWVSEGAALGIQGKAALVARAAAAMAAMPAMAAAPAMAGGVPALAARAPAAAAQAAPAINITIHAAPGQDAQAIAQAVSRELDRRERERAARAYSRIGDI